MDSKRKIDKDAVVAIDSSHNQAAPENIHHSSASMIDKEVEKARVDMEKLNVLVTQDAIDAPI